MSRIKSFIKSPAGKWTLRALMLAGTGYAFYAGYEKIHSWGGWPLHQFIWTYLALAAFCSLLGNVAKALCWRLMFAVRPKILVLMAASGVSAVAALLLPGEFCDAVRIWSVRKMDKRQDTGTITVSLGTSGILDPVAMALFAIVSALILSISTVFKLALVGYGLIGLVLAAIVILLPRALNHPKLSRNKMVQFFAKRWPNQHNAAHAVAGSLVAFLLRSLSMVFLLLALGVGGSVSFTTLYLMMMAVQCAGAVAMVVPIAPSATQAGAAGAVLASAGVTGSVALAFGIAAQFLSAFVGVTFVIGVLVTVAVRKLTGKSQKAGAAS